MLELATEYPTLTTIEPFPTEAPGFVVAHAGRDAGNMDTRFGSDHEVEAARCFLRGQTPAEKAFVLWAQNGVDFTDLSQPSAEYQHKARPGLQSETAIIGDGLITRDPNVGLVLNPADCLPIAVYQPRQQLLALIHIGWRAAVGRLEQTMLQQAQFDPNGAVAYIGPGIKTASHWTADLRPEQTTAEWQPHIASRSTGYSVDLVGLATSRLIDYGFDPEAIAVSPVDTAASADYFSYTRHKLYGESQGRNGFITAFAS